MVREKELEGTDMRAVRSTVLGQQGENRWAECAGRGQARGELSEGDCLLALVSLHPMSAAGPQLSVRQSQGSSHCYAREKQSQSPLLKKTETVDLCRDC